MKAVFGPISTLFCRLLITIPVLVQCGGAIVAMPYVVLEAFVFFPNASGLTG
jgi:hypothetical protein